MSNPPPGEHDTEQLPENVVAEIHRELENKSRVSLLLYHSDGAETVVLFSDVPIIVGRDLPSDIRIPDLTLSREHARFTLSDGAVIVEDLDSTNGTWLAGQPVRSATMNPGDEVILGGVTACLHILSPSEASVGLESHERFLSRIDEEVVRAQHYRTRFAVLMVRSEQPGVHVGRWVPSVRQALRPIDRLALYSPDAIHVLMPDAGEQVVSDVTQAITRRSDQVLCVGAAFYPGSATTADKLVEMARVASINASAEQPYWSAPSTRWVAGEAPVSVSLIKSQGIVAGKAMRELLETASRVANSRIPVVINGETGTGKEVIARFIHESGPRAKRPMICVNSGAIARELVESFFFGHEKGAFTGASQAQRGVFEEADGGTVFLDEIGELPLPAQAALLRVLETKKITRVGSNKEILIDVRVIAATHRDLDVMCDEDAFRKDLYYRLNTITLSVPPLRDRQDEIEPLALHFLREANEANRREVRGFEPEAMALLRNHRWPGNVRELKNAIERAVVITRSDRVRDQDLPSAVRAAGGVARGRGARIDQPTLVDPEIDGAISSRPGQIRTLKARMAHYEGQVILSTLRSVRWNQTEAAKQLGMPLRTLVHKIRVLGIKRM